MASLSPFNNDTDPETSTFNGINNEAVEESSVISPVRQTTDMPPGSPRGAANSNTQSPFLLPSFRVSTASVGSLPPVYSSAAVENVSDRRTTELDDSNNNPHIEEVAQSEETTRSQNGNNVLAVAEIVPSSNTSLDDFGNDFDDRIEDRAIEIARRVLNEIRQNTVHAISSTIPEAQEPQTSLPKELLRNAEAERQRIHLLLARRRIHRLVTATLVFVTTALVISLAVLLSAENERGSDPPYYPAPSENCSFCAGGVQSSKSLEQLRQTPIRVDSSHLTCADLIVHQQLLSSSDMNCPVLQSLAFIYDCGCPTVPSRPPNASCTACPGGVVPTGKHCDQVDAAVTIVGSASFYLKKCDYYRRSWFSEDCNCPTNNKKKNNAPSLYGTYPTGPCVYCVENAKNDFPLNSSLSIIQLLDAAPNHTTFSEILKITRINGYLNADYNATLFAPTNEAFAALPFPYHYYVFTYDWIYHLVALTSSHIAPEPLNATEIFSWDELPVNGGINLTVDRANQTIADLAMILIADVPASNGYIHVPDRVFLIDELRTTLLDTASIRANELGFSIFQKLIEFAQVEEVLVQVLRFGLTMFVPSDSAFDALDQEFVDGLTLPGNENKTREIVLFHLLRFNLYQNVVMQYNQNLNRIEVGAISFNNLSLWFTANAADSVALFVNAARIHEEYLAQNGLIKVIDKVLMPPTIDDLLRTTTDVTASYSFEIFLRIVDGPAEMSAFFTQNGSLMLFAPLDVAFNSTSNQLQRWLEPGWLLHLQSFVRHHCVAQEIRNSELAAGVHTFQTLSGFNTTIEASSNGNSTTDDLTWGSLVAGKYFGSPNITLENGPNVTLKNLFATNGIIYGIDGVLLPPWTKSDIHQTLAQKIDVSTFLALTELSNLTSFLVGSGPFTVLAPNNAALAAVVGDVLEAANITMIREVLLRHMSFWGNMYSYQFSNVYVETQISNIFVGGAILERDVLCNNGVIHVIDQVFQ